MKNITKNQLAAITLLIGLLAGMLIQTKRVYPELGPAEVVNQAVFVDAPLPVVVLSQSNTRYTLSQSNTEYVCSVPIRGVSITGNNIYLHDCNFPNNDSSQGAINVTGNDNRIEFNTIFGSCMAGIITSGDRNTFLINDISGSRQCDGQSGKDADGARDQGIGNKWLYNYIHDIVKTTTINSTAHSDCFQSWEELRDTIFEGNVCEDIANAGIQTDAAADTSNLTIRYNVFEAGRGLNLRCNKCLIEHNVFIGRLSFEYTSSYALIQSSSEITLTNNIFINAGILATVKQGGNNVFWGISRHRDSEYHGASGSLKWPSDKWFTVNPMITTDYYTGNQSLCYAGLGCVGVVTTPTRTPTVGPAVTRTPTRTITSTVTRAATVSPTPSRTPTLTKTPTVTPTRTRTSTPTATRTRTPTATRTATLTASMTPTYTNSPEPEITGTSTLEISATVTNTPTLTETRTMTPIVVTITPTKTPAPTPAPSCPWLGWSRFWEWWRCVRK